MMSKCVFILTIIYLFIFSEDCRAQYSKEECDSIKNVASLEYENGNYEQAIELLQKVIPSLKKILGESHEEYLISLENLCVYNAYAENYDEAIDIIKKVIKIKKTKLGEKHTEYASSLQLLAFIYGNINKYQEAIIEESKALSIIEYNSGNNNIEYAESLDNIGRFNYEIGNYSKAIDFGTRALNIRERLFGKKNSDYASALSNISNYYADNGRYSKAIKFATEALKIKEEILGANSIECAYLLGNIARIYRLMGKYEEAKQFYDKTLDVAENILEKEHPDYLIWLNNLSVCYYYLNNVGEAIKLANEVLIIREKVLGKSHIDYGMTLHNIAAFYGDIGNIPKAIELEEEVLNIYQKNLGTSHPEYAEALSNLAYYYSEISNFEKSLCLYQKALSIYENSVGKDNPDYIQCLSDLSDFYSNDGNIQKAIDTQKEVLRRYARTIGKEHPSYIMSLRALAHHYDQKGNIDEAIRLLHKALDISNKLYPKSELYFGIIGDLSLLYYQDEKLSRFEEYWREYFEMRKQKMKKELMNMTSKNRVSWVDDNYNYFKEWIPYFAERANYYLFSDLVYNSALICKGIILDTDDELSKLLVESKDSSIVDLYNKLQDNLIFLKEQSDNPQTDYLVLDSLEMAITEIEYQLIDKSKIYGDFTKNLSIDWKQVQENLGKNDIAIEMISFPVSNDSTMYCALTVKKDYENPKMIPLFEAKQLAKIHPRRYYTSNIISNFVWKPLEDELSGVKNVYFAPDGELYNIAIESLKHYNGNGFMFEEWNFYRLSSTRELVKIKSDKNTSNVILYGGLDYDANISDLLPYSENNDNLHYSSTRSILDSIGLRAGFAPLESTLSEVKQIDSLFSIVNVPSKLYVGLDGTEASFKCLSGKRFSNLHIATHGFYWSESDLNNNIDLKKLPFISEEDKPKFVEDKAMTRSGLLFSGANKVLTHQDSIPKGYEDGILTAQEISTLDFRGLDLLVLSACQTGLGEIKGDGVFGLQRGFKKAGAQTIMMSLWKVDDFATQMLMTEFYKGLTDGLPKQEAFLKAQKTVRNFKGEIDGVYKDFSNPRYWAAFIMLDGIY